jgi:hypothetical protein
LQNNRPSRRILNISADLAPGPKPAFPVHSRKRTIRPEAGVIGSEKICGKFALSQVQKHPAKIPRITESTT